MGDAMREDIFLEVNNRIERSLRRRFWLRISAVAASVTLLFSISNYISFHEGYKKLNSQMVEMVNPMGMRSSVVLSDGTKVILNAGTTLSYPTAFVSGQREVKVNGEAFFEVSHDKEHPFIVSAENVKVKVLGTKFNVEAYSDSEEFSTSLMEGSVKVTDNSAVSASVLLKPDQEVHMKDGRLLVSFIDDYDHFRWRDGLVCFDNIAFNELMKRFEKCYGISIVVENKNLEEYSCSGKFRISDGLDNALRILQRNAKYTFERNDDNTIVYIK